MFNCYKKIDLPWLKAHHQRIYFFGLGFIQVKIDDTYRLHFYHPELPSFVESPHNHRYNFSSTILKGKFTNILFEVESGEEYEIIKESCQEEKIKIPGKIKLANLKEISRKFYTQGQSYEMAHQSFHVAHGVNCITLLQRGTYQEASAEVAHRRGYPPKCPFSQKVPEERLWALVEEMIKD